MIHIIIMITNHHILIFDHFGDLMFDDFDHF